MATFTATQASILNNKTVVTINSGESVANVRTGDFLVIANFAPSQITGAYVGGAGEQFIELAISWKHGDQTNQPAIVIPTTVEVRKAVAALQAANLTLNDNFEAMQNWQTKTGTVTFKNLDGTQSTVPTLASFLSTVGTAAALDVLGTASQSEGTPTGAIIERGSNANGEYTKFADGTLISSHRNVDVPYGNPARLTRTISHPVRYAAPPAATASFSDSQSIETLGFATKAVGAIVTRMEDTGTGGDVRLYSTTGVNFTPGDTIKVSYICVGRWF